MNDNHLFKLARECSFKSDYSGGGKAHIGCIVVYKGSVLAKGWNTDRTHTDQARFNRWRYKDYGNNYLPCKIHAEQMCISKIKYLDIDFSKVHLYIYREFSNGRLAMCRPCPSCCAAMKALGIRHIHYTTEDGYCYEKFIQKPNWLLFLYEIILKNRRW